MISLTLTYNDLRYIKANSWGKKLDCWKVNLQIQSQKLVAPYSLCHNAMMHCGLNYHRLFTGSLFQAMDTFLGPYFHFCLEPALET